MSKEMLEHAESVLSDFCDVPTDIEIVDEDLDGLLDPYTTEEKITMSSERTIGLEPHQISQLAQHILRRLPEFANPEESDVAFDVIYEAISEVVNE